DFKRGLPDIFVHLDGDIRVVTVSEEIPDRAACAVRSFARIAQFGHAALLSGSRPGAGLFRGSTISAAASRKGQNKATTKKGARGFRQSHRKLPFNLNGCLA